MRGEVSSRLRVIVQRLGGGGRVQRRAEWVPVSFFLRILVSLLLLVAAVYADDMVSIPGGTFIMGGKGGDPDEVPPRSVQIPPFRMDVHEVTYAKYQECVKRASCTPAHYDDGKCLLWTSRGFRKVRIPLRYRADSYPVVCVTWQQARQYCRFRGKRLPTEAQWEYAALAGKNGTYAWGNAPPSAGRCAPRSRNHPSNVGSYPANAWGLYDMTGNVWEWTNDRYAADAYGHDARRNPRGPTVGRYRVIRGGGWYSGRKQLRVRNRHWFPPTRAEASIGFRCVK